MAAWLSGRANVNPCSIPNGLFTYHSIRPAPCASDTREPCICDSGAAFNTAWCVLWVYRTSLMLTLACAGVLRCRPIESRRNARCCSGLVNTMPRLVRAAFQLAGRWFASVSATAGIRFVGKDTELAWNARLTAVDGREPETTAVIVATANKTDSGKRLRVEIRNRDSQWFFIAIPPLI